MRQVIRGLKGITGLALISTLLLSLSVSAAIPGAMDGSEYAAIAPAITTENASDMQRTISEVTTQPMTIADSCWVYIGGYIIYICNHDEPLINRI